MLATLRTCLLRLAYSTPTPITRRLVKPGGHSEQLKPGERLLHRAMMSHGLAIAHCNKHMYINQLNSDGTSCDGKRTSLMSLHAMPSPS